MRINRVGVTAVPWAFNFAPKTDSEDSHPTIGSMDMFVELAADQKGTHMSRFMQLLRDHDQILNYAVLRQFFEKIKQHLNATQAYGTVRFPFFVERTAPETGQKGRVQIQVILELAAGNDNALVTTVQGPATSLCPCSKEISAYGAHNQRCELSATIKFSENCEVGIDELFGMIESAASCKVFPVLKRADEKSVTETAYDNPKFVEDIVRDMASILGEDPRIAWFRCSSENFESIHQHNAFAEIESS